MEVHGLAVTDCIHFCCYEHTSCQLQVSDAALTVSSVSAPEAQKRLAVASSEMNVNLSETCGYLCIISKREQLRCVVLLWMCGTLQKPWSLSRCADVRAVFIWQTESGASLGLVSVHTQSTQDFLSPNIFYLYGFFTNSGQQSPPRPNHFPTSPSNLILHLVADGAQTIHVRAPNGSCSYEWLHGLRH